MQRRRQLLGASLAATIAFSALAATSPAQAAPTPAPTPGVLISEVASGGPTGSSDNFIEIANFGDAAVDVGGWRIFRCGQSGDAYGPQAVIPAGTTLAPGQQFTAVRSGSALAAAGVGDAVYDTSLHSFGFGAYLETAENAVVDRVGFYAPGIDSQCQNPTTIQRSASWLHGESHQRVAATGALETDWITAPRTPAAANATAPSDIRRPGDIRVSEFAPGGPAGNDDFIEIANYGRDPIDLGGWSLYRCGDNSQSYVQHAGLPAGTRLAPGDTFTFARAGSGLPADATYPTSLHWVNSGAMILDPDKNIVDRMSVYRDRQSPCTDGTAAVMDIDTADGLSFQRNTSTGDNAADFVRAARTPDELPAGPITPAEPAAVVPGPIQITELAAAGPAGANDDFFELTNTGETPVSLSGWSAYRCEGTGRRSATPQIADLGVTLAPGESYLATAAKAPAALRDRAQATYSTGMNEKDGFGLIVRDSAGTTVDAVGVYNTVSYSACVQGYAVQNFAKTEAGESYQRSRSTGVNGDDFLIAERTPGSHTDIPWSDPTVPLTGQLDPVAVETRQQPGTPRAITGDKDSEGRITTRVTTEHGNGGELSVSFRSANPVPLDEAATRSLTGVTREVPPAQREIDGEVPATTGALIAGAEGGFPFQRFELAIDEVPAEGVELSWSGTTAPRNEIQMYGWDPATAGWQLIDRGVPSADGQLTLIGALTPGMVSAEGAASVLVLDGPRTTGGLLEEVGVQDGEFVNPGRYDLAINHMTDTQFLSEGFLRVYTDMAAWVVANADARKIAYNAHTGDIIQNWINGHSDPERARREFRAASRIQALMDEAGVANGILPGNHDNLWGRNNDMFNEYFPVERYADRSWWGGAWAEGDNSAHYDRIVRQGVEFLVIHLPYNPTDAQIAWGSTIAAENPQANVVVATHAYLYTDGTRDNRDANRYTARGDEIWSNLVAPNDNVFLVLGGHYHGVSTQLADPVTGEQVDATELDGGTVVLDNVGSTGRRVVEMLADYQGYRSTQPDARADTLDRDTGFQRLLQLDIDAGLMAVNAYSPSLGAYDAWRYDEPAFRGDKARYDASDDEFVVQLSLNRPTAFRTVGWGVQGASSEAATVTVAAGATAEHRWEAAQAGLLWHAVVTDGAETESGIAAVRARAADGVLHEPTVAQQDVPRAEGAGPQSAVRELAETPAVAEQAPRDADALTEAPQPEVPGNTPGDAGALDGATEDAAGSNEPSTEAATPTPTPSAGVATPTPSPETVAPLVRATERMNAPTPTTGARVISVPAPLGTGGEVDPGEPGDSDANSDAGSEGGSDGGSTAGAQANTQADAQSDADANGAAAAGDDANSAGTAESSADADAGATADTTAGSAADADAGSGTSADATSSGSAQAGGAGSSSGSDSDAGTSSGSAAGAEAAGPGETLPSTGAEAAGPLLAAALTLLAAGVAVLLRRRRMARAEG